MSILKRTDFACPCTAEKMGQRHQKPISADALCKAYLVSPKRKAAFALAEK